MRLAFPALLVLGPIPLVTALVGFEIIPNAHGIAVAFSTVGRTKHTVGNRQLEGFLVVGRASFGVRSKFSTDFGFAARAFTLDIFTEIFDNVGGEGVVELDAVHSGGDCG